LLLRDRGRRRDLLATAHPSFDDARHAGGPPWRRPTPAAHAQSASAAAPPPAEHTSDDNDPTTTAATIDVDAIPPTDALRVRGVLSPIHAHPGPWAPPLLVETDRAPDAFLRVTSLRPGPIWYPAWMRYRRRDGNDIFWSDALSRNTLDVPRFERRWTLFSTVWYLLKWWRFRGFPPTFRYLIASAYRAARQRLYEGHKRLVLWQCKLEAALAERAVERRRRAAAAAAAAEAGGEGGVAAAAAEAAAAAAAGGGAEGDGSGSSGDSSDGAPPCPPLPFGPRPGAAFSRLMALRRLHWQNSPVAELLYLQNVAITGRVHQLPPRVQRQSPPTFFWLF
jgi:hypothetical protein